MYLCLNVKPIKVYVLFILKYVTGLIITSTKGESSLVTVHHYILNLWTVEKHNTLITIIFVTYFYFVILYSESVILI